LIKMLDLRQGIDATEKEFGVLVKVRFERGEDFTPSYYAVGVGKFGRIHGKPVAFVTKRIVRMVPDLDPESLVLAMRAGADDVLEAWGNEVKDKCTSPPTGVSGSASSRVKQTRSPSANGV